MTMFNSKVETVWQVIEADKFMTFDDSLAKTQEVIKQLENQDMESIGFVPTLEFGVLFPEAMNNMIENRNIIKK
jgi:hypothetical protein